MGIGRRRKWDFLVDFCIPVGRNVQLEVEFRSWTPGTPPREESWGRSGLSLQRTG